MNNIFLKRAIFGFIFCGIILIALFFIEKKDNERMNRVNTEQNRIYTTENNQVYNLNGINNESISIQDLYEGEDDAKYKEEINSLIDKGLKSYSNNVDAFIYYEGLSDEASKSAIFFDKDYKSLVEYISLLKYKDDGYKFNKLKDTDNYIWGSFSKKNSNEKPTYVVIDKLDGKIKALNNNSIQLIVY